MSRKEAVLTFSERVEPGPIRRILDVIERVFAREVSLVDIALLLEAAGFTVVNAAASPGTALTRSRTEVDFQDAGIDSVRLLVRGENSAAGSVTVQAYNVTQGAVMASATILDATEQSAESAWTRFVPAGGDEEIEVRVVGDGAFDPVLYGVRLQGRTTQARL